MDVCSYGLAWCWGVLLWILENMILSVMQSQLTMASNESACCTVQVNVQRPKLGVAKHMRRKWLLPVVMYVHGGSA